MSISFIIFSLGNILSAIALKIHFCIIFTDKINPDKTAAGPMTPFLKNFGYVVEKNAGLCYNLYEFVEYK